MELRRSSRIPQPSTRLKDFIICKVQYPIQNFISYDTISSQYLTFLSSINQEQEPNSYLEAQQNPIWCKAMKEELKALGKNKTWVIVQLSKGKKTGWVQMGLQNQV
jgi:hypothetical protein